MKLCPSRLLLLLVVGTAVVSAPAQETLVNSKPTDITADKANSFLGDPKHQINAGDYNAPRKLFNDYGPSLPMPRPIIINQDPAAADAMNKRKNWMLLTPEQILGVETPEDILHTKNPNEKKLSLEEQYLQRLNHAGNSAITNGSLSALSGKDDNNPFTKKKDDQNPFSRGPFANQNELQKSGSLRPLNQLFNSRVSDSMSNDKREQESAWTSVFAQPTQPKLTPEQLADRERFRALLEPSSQPDKPATTVRYTEATTPPPDPYIQLQPKFNPAGRTYTSLENNSARPTGINPLPGITGPSPKPVEKKPSWQAQLPPWMSDGPKKHNPNQNF